MRQVIPVILTAALALSVACGDLSTNTPADAAGGAPPSQKVHSAPAADIPVLRGPQSLSLVACIDGSSSYPRVLLDRAREQLRWLFEQRLAPSHMRTNAWVRWITHHSADESADLVAFRIGAIPDTPVRAADPPQPKLHDLEDPALMYNRDKRQQLEAENQDRSLRWRDAIAAIDAAYQQDLEKQRAVLAHETTALALVMDALVGAEPPAAQGSDVGGCLTKAAGILAREPGERRLVLFTDLVAWGTQNIKNLKLEGVTVRVVLHCDSQVECEREEATWNPVFAAAGVSVIEYYDPAEDLAGLLD
ncbi:MAG: hypothetical protein AB7N70_24710 [Dehalococcoidia bacterium]